MVVQCFSREGGGGIRICSSYRSLRNVFQISISPSRRWDLVAFYIPNMVRARLFCVPVRNILAEGSSAYLVFKHTGCFTP